MPLVSRVRGVHLLRDHATPSDCRHRIRTGCRVDAIHVSVAHLDRGRVITELLSRGSRVRISAGAPFPKDSASLFAESICRRTFIEQSDRSGEFAPHPGDFTITRFPQQNSSSYFGRVLHRAENDSWSLATNAGGRFTTRGADGIVCAAMNELRDLRRHRHSGSLRLAAESLAALVLGIDLPAPLVVDSLAHALSPLATRNPGISTTLLSEFMR